MGRLLRFPDLASVKGIPFTRMHIYRLVKSGRFPAPITLGERSTFWVESEIDAYLQQAMSTRPAAPNPEASV